MPTQFDSPHQNKPPTARRHNIVFTSVRLSVLLVTGVSLSACGVERSTGDTARDSGGPMMTDSRAADVTDTFDIGIGALDGGPTVERDATVRDAALSRDSETNSDAAMRPDSFVPAVDAEPIQPDQGELFDDAAVGAGDAGRQDPNQILFRLDTRCRNQNAGTVRLVGHRWNNWDPNSGPVAGDPDGDGVWEVIVDVEGREQFDYLWNVDGAYEALIGAGDCAPSTDRATYANRRWERGEGERDDSYNSCEQCVPIEPEPAPDQLVLSLDTRCAPARPGSVRIVGPWWNGWDPNAGPIANDPDQDGVWQVVFEPAPGADMEYLWNVDGTYENLIGAGACAPITDGANFANRRWSPGTGDRTDAYDSCIPCDGEPMEPPVDPARPRITVDGRRIRIDGQTFHVKGVNWSPVPRGANYPQGLDFSGFVERDAPLMQAAGINVVRTYEPIRDRAVLDTLWAHRIYVMNTVYSWGGAPVDSAVAIVNEVGFHPAILMWVIGNEWNYNGLYSGLNHGQAVQRIADVARAVKNADRSRPVATIYGEVPSPETLGQLAAIDVWGLNVYRGIVFGDVFDTFARRSGKPMFLGEYGADAYNANIGAEDQRAQAEATTRLTQIIVDNSTVTGGTCSGGVIFEWADEWWKAGEPNVHNIGGAAPGGGPHPDGVFNEEWWGLLEIDGTPRAAYRAYQQVAVPVEP